jgi:putative transposase
VIYRLIAQWPAEASVARLCQLLGVSRSGYYEACRRYAQPAKVCPVSVHLIAAFEASEKAYGSRRLRQDLLDLDIDIGLHHTRTLMALPGGGAGPVRPQGRRLGDGTEHAR